jgi:hypothetical protein
MNLKLPHLNLKHIVSHAEHDISSAYKTVAKDVGSAGQFVAKNVGSAGKFVINSELKALNTIGDTTKNVFKEMSTPLMFLGIGAVALFIMTRR